MRDILQFSQLENNINNDAEEFAAVCEARYKEFIVGLGKRVLSDDIGVVYVCGQSSSGKTTTTTRLETYINKYSGKKAHRIELDSFYLPKEQHRVNKQGIFDFETVFSLDLPAIYKFKKDIDAGEPVILSDFSFSEDKRIIPQKTLINKDDILIFDGIHSFNKRIQNTFGIERSLSVFITVNTDIHFDNTILKANDLRFLRRLVRDYNHRNATPEYTLKLWKMVRAGEKRYVSGYMKKADVFFNTFLDYEPYIFRDKAITLMDTVKTSETGSVYIKSLLNKLARFSSPNEKININEKSILNEFI